MNNFSKTGAIIEIENEHSNDKEQLRVIKANDNKVMVEAPAGYGKTRTMINKIKYLIFTNQLSKNKKILCLTFSVNSTDKVEREISSSFKEHNIDYRELIKIGNYHNIAMNILLKYGFLLQEKLKDFDQLTVINQNDPCIKNKLSEREIKFLDEFSRIIKTGTIFESFNNDYLIKYNYIVKNKFLTNNFITYDSILTLCAELLYDNKEIQKFYQKLYPIIIIDEFQDTNILSLTFLRTLVNEKTVLYLFGDSLQKIYGFIGAISNLIDIISEEYDMDYIALKNNYRFSDNESLLLLDNNIRENIKSQTGDGITQNSEVKVYFEKDQLQEAERIYSLIQSLSNKGTDIVILFRNRNKNTQVILEYLNQKKVAVYNGLFNTSDINYELFHDEVNRIFLDYIKNNKKNYSFTKRDIKLLINIVNEELSNKVEMFDSYVELLEAFLRYCCLEYSYEFRNEYIQRVLQKHELKNYLNFINNKVVITTIHSAKGLEWKYVILPDLESSIFPNSYFVKDNYDQFINELCIFYVAFTRAQQGVYFTASKLAYGNGKAKNCLFKTDISSFFCLPGLSVSLVE
ncbi:UvrD-helicase domain-containing protein [Tetragenococcus halophilus]|uniref:UvrD-helicase domain-containing protein n=1 Tax=Tetragenococcus halophilus TaxID=51669 RepID=UPI000B92D0D4|nr:ATP-dependent helicase [Tetragenococcus halophilus]